MRSVGCLSVVWVLALALPLSSCAQNARRYTDPVPRNATIFVARRGWHIDVGFPSTELTAELNALDVELPGARSLFIGFGDRRYLMSRGRGVRSLFAALWPGRGLLLVTGLTADPEHAFGPAQVITLHVTAEQARAAVQFVEESVGEAKSATHADATGPPPAAARLPIVSPGPYSGSLYLEAAPAYSIFHTCNTWAAEVLEQAKLPVHSRGVVTAGQLWRQVRRISR